MSAAALTQGAIVHIMEDRNPVATPWVVQVLKLTHVEKVKRWKMTISDGIHSANVLCATQLSAPIEDGTISENCVMKILDTNRINKHIQIIDYELVESPMEIIGSPVPLKAGGEAAKQAVTVKEEIAVKEEVAASPTKQEATSEDPMHVDKKPDMGSPTPKGPALTSPAPSPPKAEAGSPISMSQSAGNLMPIDQLNPYCSCKIKGRVVTKEEMRTVKPKNGGPDKHVFSIVIMDDTCDLKVTMWDDMATKYHASIEVGKSYTFTTGSGTTRMGDRFNPTRCPYVLTLNSKSVIEQCTDNDAPKVTFRFVGIDQLEAHIKKGGVDVIGILQEVSSMAEITIKSGSDAGKNKSKRNVTLVDTSGKQVSLTLWDDMANQVQEADGSRHAVLAVRSVRVGDYQGCSLSTSRMSMVELDPELEEAKALKEWYEGSKKTTFEAVGGGGGAGGGYGPAPRKFMGDIESQSLGSSSAKPDVFMVSGDITWLNNEKTWQYPSNPETKRKVTQEGDKWRDEKSQELLDTCLRRYILPAKISDHTGGSFVTIFDDDAKKIFGGVTADEMWEMQHTDEEGFKALWKNALFKQYTVKVRAKTEKYNDEERVKVSSLNLEPLSYAAEMPQLLERIRRYVN